MNALAPSPSPHPAVTALCLAGALVSCGPFWLPQWSGRVYTSPRLHVGLRPAIVEGPLGELAPGVTVRVSVP